MATRIKITGITGSLRVKSYNLSALCAAVELLPDGSTLEIVDLSFNSIF